MSLSLITGASSGIGKAMAKQLAADGHDLLLIARRKEKLEELAKELEEKYTIQAYVLAIDLTDDTAISKIKEFLTDHNQEVNILINNAGFGGLGTFQDREIAKDLSMIDLNIKAVVSLTHALLPTLIKNGGKILNVGSTAGFMPGPLQATYFATKAFVNSWSQALAQELETTGVTVSVLCPGATASEFAKSADATDSNLFKGELETAVSVARKGLDGMMKGKRVIITDWKLWFVKTFILPIIPQSMVLKMVEKMQS